LCQREHEKENAFLSVRPDGGVYFHCRRIDKQSYKIGNVKIHLPDTEGKNDTDPDADADGEGEGEGEGEDDADADTEGEEVVGLTEQDIFSKLHSLGNICIKKK
jgi:hypothetical protein